MWIELNSRAREEIWEDLFDHRNVSHYYVNEGAKLLSDNEEMLSGNRIMTSAHLVAEVLVNIPTCFGWNSVYK